MTRNRQAGGTSWRRAVLAGVGVLALLVSACGDDTASNGAGGSGDGGDAPAEQDDGGSGSGSGSLVLDGEVYELTSFRCGTTVDDDQYWGGSGGSRLSAEIRMFEGSDYEVYSVHVRLPTEGGDVASGGDFEVWEGEFSTEADGGEGDVEVDGNQIRAHLDLTQIQVDMTLVEDGPTVGAEIELVCP